MVKFVIIFHRPKNLPNFETAYTDLLALIERMPDIQRRQVVDVLGSPVGEPPFYRALEIYFANLDQFQISLRSKAGQEAGAELGRRFEPNSYQAYFAEVYEEAGGSTPT